jgi:DNA gyrase subunit A
MTTSIPPHNLGEVCDALVYLIDNFDKIGDVTVEDLTRFVQGPDFPTGGVVYRYAGQDGDGDRVDLIRNAYALGRGRLTVQAHVHIEEMSRNRSRIVVTELPYQTNKTRLIERIAELVRDGKLEGITDLRDESDRQGMRICIELTRTVEPREVLSQLFRLTPMQTTFSLAMLALVDGEPRLLPLKRVLIHYLDHRQEIISRRSRYLLERAKQRAHILEGLLKALDYIDGVIDTIRRSRTSDTAHSNLMKRFEFTEIQAQAILDMPLKRLAGLERRRIADEHKDRLQEMEYLQSLLGSPAKIRRIIREDLLALKEKYGDARRTRIVDQEKGHHTARDLVEEQDVLVTLWQDGQVVRTNRAPRASAKAVPVTQVWGNTRDDVAFFAASGQAASVPLHQIPDGQSTPVSSVTDLDRSETLVAALVLPHPSGDEELPETYVTLVTRGGRIKRVTVEDLAAASRGTVSAIKVEESDQLAWAVETNGQDEILLVTRQGKAIRFSESDVRPMGLSAAGVLAIKLATDDVIVGTGVVRGDAYVIVFSEMGYAKRTAIDEYPAQRRYGGGVQAAKITSRTGPVAVAILASEGSNMVLTTSKGQAIKLPVKAVHSMGRATSGNRSRQDTKEPHFDPVKHGVPVGLTVLADAEPEAERTGTQEQEPEKTVSRSRSADKAPPAKRSSKAKADAPSKKAPTRRRSKTKTKAPADGAAASSRGQSTAGETATPQEGVAEQLSLPMQSAPSKKGTKPRTRKRKPVRSVPDS